MSKNDISTLARQYTYRVTWSEEDKEFIGLCAEFPSLSWTDKKQEDAFNGIISLVKETLNDMRQEHETIPEPLSLHKYSGKFLVIKSTEAGISLNRFINSILGGC